MKCNLQKVPGYHDPYNAMGQEMNVVEGFQNPNATIREDVYLGEYHYYRLVVFMNRNMKNPVGYEGMCSQDPRSRSLSVTV